MRRLFLIAAWVMIPVMLAVVPGSVIFAVKMFGFDVIWRLTPPQAIFAIPIYLWYFPAASAVLAGWSYLVGVGLMAVPTLYLAWGMYRRRRRLRAAGLGVPAIAPVRAASSTHGDADWLPMDEAHDIFAGEHPDWGGIPLGEAYRPDLDRTRHHPFDERRPETWGQGGRAPLLLSPLTTGALSGIIIAGSGSHKTTSFTVTAMLTYRGSAVVLDPSTQVGPMVASARRAMGQHVATVDPLRPELGFNVLGCIDLADPLAIVHVAEVIDWCMPTPDDGGAEKNGQYFIDKAKELAACMMTDLLWDESLARGQRTMKEWRRRLVTPEPEMRTLLGKIYANSQSQYARDLAAGLMRTFHETFSGIYSHCTGATRFLSIPAYAEMLSANAFDPADLMRGKLTVFIQIPDEAMMATPAVARVVIGSLARTVLRARGNVVTPIPFILDEMDLLKFMAILAVLRDQGRKSGVALFPMWQSVGQIEKTWGKDGKKSWYASAGWRLYAAINDEETAVEVSKRCGTYTVLTHSEGTSTSLQSALNSGGRTRSYSGNVSEQRQELLSPYQAQTGLSPDEAILIPKGRRAARIGRSMYFRRPEMAARVAVDQFQRLPVKEVI